MATNYFIGYLVSNQLESSVKSSKGHLFIKVSLKFDVLACRMTFCRFLRPCSAQVKCPIVFVLQGILN